MMEQTSTQTTTSSAPRLRKYPNGTTYDARPFWKIDGSAHKTYYTKGDLQSELRAKKRCMEKNTKQ
jgi:hypothetical protein